MALSLVGSAVLLCACEDTPPVDPAAEENMMTEYCEDLTIVESENGQRSYRFTAPLVEGYSQAREPYREFRKGVRMVTYQDDSLSSVDVVLTANYAIYYEKRKLWEAKGNVVVEKFDGKKLYTQQLFWNATTKKVYSNVDTRIVQGDRVDAIGAGFETDEEFKDWRFRYSRGQTEVHVAPREPSDSVHQA
ncbi:MAG: LPS export ABC transporter periplasmic protein LptC, partial [Alistipes sp.]|nr:LPS export ABC transporter periplasmic protein LptC [Alistipes sp.]